jgi:hypothetical protein
MSNRLYWLTLYESPKRRTSEPFVTYRKEPPVKMKLFNLGSSIAVASLAIGSLTLATSDHVNGVPLFEYETKRLEGPGPGTNTSKNADLFAFNTIRPSTILKSGECKPRPGDAAWPSQEVWDDFDKVLGCGALIRTVPLAAPCYDNWGVYDSAKCRYITNNWTDPYYQ